MIGYIRTDISCMNRHVLTVIPTIELSAWTKGIEISFMFLTFCIYATISYIKECDYEP